MRGGGRTSGSHDNALVSGLYQQITGAQEAQFAAGYDLEAGLNRYQIWLREHADDTSVTPAAAEADAVRPEAFLAAPVGRTEWSAELAVIELYAMHYSALVRLAVM